MGALNLTQGVVIIEEDVTDFLGSSRKFDVMPQNKEAVLQFRSGISYVKSGK
jgi:hypothetical protein